MAVKYRIKQYYTLNGSLDIKEHYSDGFEIMLNRILDRFLSDYSMTRTEWIPSEHPYGYTCKKCFINFDGIQNLFEVYFYYELENACGAMYGFSSPNNPYEWPDGPVSSTGDQWLPDGWASYDSMYMNVLEKYDDDGGEPPEIGEILGFSFPRRMSLRNTEPVVDPGTKSNGYCFFDTVGKIAYELEGCYPNGDIYNNYQPWDYWIFDYSNFKFKGRLSNRYRSFNSNSRCIVSQVMYEDEYNNTSSLEIECLADVYNNSFQSKEGKTVHTADKEYIITNAMYGTCIAYDVYLPVPIPGENPPNSGGIS